VSVQAREDFTSFGQWFWDNRLVISNSGAAWQNPNGGFGANCPTWGRKTTCLPTQNGPDQLFRLVGTLGIGTPAAAAAEDYTNAQAASDAGATPVVGSRLIGIVEAELAKETREFLPRLPNASASEIRSTP
jgi:hypothetical protein